MTDFDTTRDGRALVIRPVEPADKPLLLDGLERMSELSRYRRFLAAKPGFTSSELAYLTELDHDDHEALIALDGAGGDLVGVARYVRLASEPEAAEAAIAVVDDWQGVGVGAALLGCLARQAAAHGVSHFRATVLRDNGQVFRLLDRMKLPYSLHSSPLGGTTAELKVDLTAMRRQRSSGPASASAQR